MTSSAVEAAGQARDVYSLLKRQLQTEISLVWQPAYTPVVAVYSEKGGVGKSATAAGLTGCAAYNGLRVLAIDLDPRRSLTEELDAEAGPDDLTVNDILWADPNKDPAESPIRGAARQVMRQAGEAWGPNVWVIPAERALSNRESDNETPNLEMRLALSLMDDALEGIDLVVIDVPPRAGGRLVRSGLFAANQVLYPVTLDEDGFIGVRDAKHSLKQIAPTHPFGTLREVGILRNIVEKRTQVGELYDQKVQEEFEGEVLDVVVPKRSIRQESRIARVPITAAASSPAGMAVIGGYTGVLNHISIKAA